MVCRTWVGGTRDGCFLEEGWDGGGGLLRERREKAIERMREVTEEESGGYEECCGKV